MNDTNLIDGKHLFHIWNNFCSTDRITLIPETEYNLFHRRNNICSTQGMNIYSIDRKTFVSTNRITFISQIEYVVPCNM